MQIKTIYIELIFTMQMPHVWFGLCRFCSTFFLSHQNIVRFFVIFNLQRVFINFYLASFWVLNRYLGIDIATGKHVAIAPDELDLMQDIYYVKPVSNHPNIRVCDYVVRYF